MSGNISWNNSLWNISTEENETYKSEFNYLNPGTALDIGLDILLAFPLMVSCYTAVALTSYEIKIRREYLHSSNPHKEHKLYNFRFIAPWLRLLCILAAISALMRCINDFIYYKSHRENTLSCTAVKNLGVSWLVSVDTFVYLFLWVRQRVLYGNQSLKHLSKWYIHVISWSSLILILAIFVGMNVMLAFRNYYYDGEVLKRCMKVYHVVVKIIPKMWIITSSILHGFLVMLYSYPLIKHAMASVTPNQRVTTVARRGSNSGTSKLLLLVRKCAIISVVCVLTDLFTMCVTEYWLTHGNLTKLRHSLYNINAILNVICVVMSLKKWRRMLLPCCS